MYERNHDRGEGKEGIVRVMIWANEKYSWEMFWESGSYLSFQFQPT